MTSFLCISILNSCEDQLDIDPESYYVKENLFGDVNQAELSVKGIYSVFSKTETYSHLISLNYPLDNDISYMKGTGFTNDNRRIAHYGLNPSVSYIEKTWRELYKGIEYANVAIENISAMDMFSNGSDEEKSDLNALIGEAKFLRAFIYFDLVRLWGDVPLKLTSTKVSDDFNIPRTKRDLVYDQIIKDLRDAKMLLSTNTRIQNDRANMGAVRGYLVRVLLYKAGYYLDQDGVRKRPSDYKKYLKEAAIEAKEMIDLNKYNLLDSYEEVFRNLAEFKQDPTENLFEIAFYNVAQGRANSGVICTWNSPRVDAGVYGRANAYVLVRPSFKNEFSDDDKRRDVAVAEFNINKHGTKKKISANKPKYPGKWRRDWIKEPALDKNNTNVNWCTLRYADVLLMFAEAVNEVRDDLPKTVSLQDAFQAINKVRNRAGLSDIDTSISQSEFSLIIKQERKLELCFEGWRKYDLIRWNQLGEKLRETQDLLNKNYSSSNIYGNVVGYMVGKTFTENKDELLPIPQRDCDENEMLTQNPNF